MTQTQEQPWFVYMLRCNDDSLYTGITLNVTRRVLEHQNKGPKSAKYLRGKHPLQLVYTKLIGSKSEALVAERKIKAMPKAEKEKLIT